MTCVRLPRTAIPLVRWVTTWKDTARRIRASSKVMDHLPVVMKLDLHPPLVVRKQRTRWDLQQLAAGVQVGGKRPEFLRELNEALEAVQPALKVLAEEKDPTRHTMLYTETVRRVALNHYSMEAAVDQSCKQLAGGEERAAEAEAGAVTEAPWP